MLYLGHVGDGGCDWSQPPAFRELYAHTDDNGGIDVDQENANIAETPHGTVIVAMLQKQLCAANAAYPNSTVVC
jgi:hypothetical protein